MDIYHDVSQFVARQLPTIYTSMLSTLHRTLAPSVARIARTRTVHKMSMSLEYTQDRQAELKGNMESVLSEIESVSSSSSSKARLVPISKLKPASDVQALYDAGYRHFGENYIQELADKAEVVSSVLVDMAISELMGSCRGT